MPRNYTAFPGVLRGLTPPLFFFLGGGQFSIEIRLKVSEIVIERRFGCKNDLCK